MPSVELEERLSLAKRITLVGKSSIKFYQIKELITCFIEKEEEEPWKEVN